MMIKPISLVFIFALVFTSCDNTHPLTGDCIISGSTNIDPGPGALAVLYKKAAGKQWDSLTSIKIKNNKFTFTKPTGAEYLVMIRPDKAALQVTYASSVPTWSSAAIVGCDGILTLNIIMLTHDNPVAGQGKLSGKLEEGVGYIRTSPIGPLGPGSPIGGVPVKGISKTTHKIVGGAITDTNGNFEISNLPQGTYFIQIEIPGLEMISTHERTVGEISLPQADLNFIAGSAGIERK